MTTIRYNSDGKPSDKSTIDPAIQATTGNMGILEIAHAMYDGYYADHGYNRGEMIARAMGVGICKGTATTQLYY